MERFNDKVDRTGTCWLWTAHKIPLGYGVFRVNGKNQRAHRVAYELAYGKFDKTLHVLHKCDNPGCVKPSHLSLGTHQDNMRDRDAKGRQPVGINNGRAKLTEEDVIEIKTRLAAGLETQQVIANDFNVNHQQISRIKNGKLWKHIEEKGSE